MPELFIGAYIRFEETFFGESQCLKHQFALNVGLFFNKIGRAHV